MVELRLTTPPPRPGTVRSHTVSIVAEEGGRPAGKTEIRFDQRISAAPRTTATSRPMPRVGRNRPRRPVPDPNAAPTTAFESAAATTAFDPDATRRADLATARTTAVAGGGSSATTFLPLAGGRIRLEPQTVHADGGSRATFLVVADNSQGRETLRIALNKADGDGSLNYDFRPDTFEVPPAKVIASTLVVTAPLTPQSTLESPVNVRAVAGNDTVDCSGTVVQSGNVWRWVVPYLLPVLGALIAVGGAISPLTKLVNFYWFHRPDPAGPEHGSWWLAEPALSQPVIRILITVLAIAMALGLGFGGGWVTRIAALAMFIVIVGYGLYSTLWPLPVDTGGMSYGLYLVVLGAIVGYVGGLLRQQ
jgi:hypothetical protein